MFEAEFQVTWADLDSNRHLRNTGYLDYAAQTRLLYLDQAGFSPKDLNAAEIGPAMFENTIQYKKEMHFLQKFRVTVSLSALSKNGAKFIMFNRFTNEDGFLYAEVSSFGAWFSVRDRKVVEPPPGLASAMNALVREPGFNPNH